MRRQANPDHPGWRLSRNCIRDTLLAKREGALKADGRFEALYRMSIRSLRDTQLAPHQCPWRKNRILDMLTLKRAAPEVVIVVRRGLIEEVRASNPYVKVLVADYDLDRDDPDQDALICDAEERAAMPDMHIVY